ncbi:hypothetical protein L2X67_17080 [Enterobacter ludwigii]|nr:hypothetical protein [Enterobacter ludwigii]
MRSGELQPVPAPENGITHAAFGLCIRTSHAPIMPKPGKPRNPPTEISEDLIWELLAGLGSSGTRKKSVNVLTWIAENHPQYAVFVEKAFTLYGEGKLFPLKCAHVDKALRQHLENYVTRVNRPESI